MAGISVCATAGSFNSIKVRLELYRKLLAWGVAMFQFHKGAIRTGMLLCSGAGIRGFNSIKVRLERIYDDYDDYDKHLFQFHKGAIRTEAPMVGMSDNTKFQFHKGAIRTLSLRLSTDASICFNSIKVRLER